MTFFGLNLPNWVSQPAPLTFGTGVVAYLVGFVATAIRKSKEKPLRIELNNLRSENPELRVSLEEAEQAAGELSILRRHDIFRLVSDYLGHMSIEHLQLTDRERLSLYVHNNNHFQLIGRHSLNKELGKIGRPKISDSVGCLGKAWAGGGSNARLTKIIYLADWESAQEFGRQISRIEWVFNHYGPYVDDVQYEAKIDPLVEVISATTIYGTNKILMRLNQSDADYSALDISDLRVIDHVIANTQHKFWNAFIEYVYDTYPIRMNTRYANLNLVALADELKNNAQ